MNAHQRRSASDGREVRSNKLSKVQHRKAIPGAVAGLAVLVVILASASVYGFSYPPVKTVTATTTTTLVSTATQSTAVVSTRAITVVSTTTMTMQATTGSCPSMSDSMGMNTTKTMSSMTPIVQNASTADYKFMLDLGPPANMLLMCQVTNSTMSGEVMVGGQMMATNTSMTTTNAYHLEVHVFDIKTGEVVVVPINSVSISITNSSGMNMNVPVAEMFGVMEGLTDTHDGNNVQLVPGNHTIVVSVVNQRASFSITIPSM